MKTAEQLDVLLQFYMKNRSTMEPASLRSLISCLTSLLLSLECSKDMWSRDAVKKSFLLLLSFCIHENGKIRRTSQDELMKIVTKHSEEHFAETSDMIVSYLRNLKEQIDDTNYKEISHYLAFVAQAAPSLDPSTFPALLSLLIEVVFLPFSSSSFAHTNSLTWTPTA